MLIQVRVMSRERSSRPRRRRKQTELVFRTWGGCRKGAGRPRKSARRRMPHVARPRLNARHPVHVTLSVARDVPNLRADRCMAALRQAFAENRDRFGFRLAQYSVQKNHLHLVAKTNKTTSLTRGLQKLSVRIARQLNSALDRQRRVFADRYHARALATPRAVRNALRYVLLNSHHHAVRRGSSFWRWRTFDPCSSGETFDGWSSVDGYVAGGIPPPKPDRPGAEVRSDVAETVVPARRWLLRV